MTFELAGQVLAPAWPEVFHTTTLLGEMRKGPDDVQKGNHHNDDDDNFSGKLIQVETGRYSWREELEKFRATRRPLGGVSHLIDAFR